MEEQHKTIFLELVVEFSYEHMGKESYIYRNIDMRKKVNQILSLSKDCQEHLRRLSYKRSLERGQRVTISSLVTDALEDKYGTPIPEKEHFFGK